MPLLAPPILFFRCASAVAAAAAAAFLPGGADLALPAAPKSVSALKAGFDRDTDMSGVLVLWAERVGI